MLSSLGPVTGHLHPVRSVLDPDCPEQGDHVSNYMSRHSGPRSALFLLLEAPCPPGPPGLCSYHLSPRPFPTEESVGDEDIYSGLSDQIE